MSRLYYQNSKQAKQAKVDATRETEKEAKYQALVKEFSAYREKVEKDGKAQKDTKAKRRRLLTDTDPSLPASAFAEIEEDIELAR